MAGPRSDASVPSDAGAAADARAAAGRPDGFGRAIIVGWGGAAGPELSTVGCSADSAGAGDGGGEAAGEGDGAGRAAGPEPDAAVCSWLAAGPWSAAVCWRLAAGS